LFSFAVYEKVLERAQHLGIFLNSGTIAGEGPGIIVFLTILERILVLLRACLPIYVPSGNMLFKLIPFIHTAIDDIDLVKAKYTQHVQELKKVIIHFR
jgi:hypothetical protein